MIHSTPINIQISLTPGQVAADVCQALEYSTWKAHVHINQRIPTPVSKELLSEDILRMAHTVHSVRLSIFRAQGPPDSSLSSCDPPFWCHGFNAMGIFRFHLLYWLCFEWVRSKSLSILNLSLCEKPKKGWDPLQKKRDKYVTHIQIVCSYRNPLIVLSLALPPWWHESPKAGTSWALLQTCTELFLA